MASTTTNKNIFELLSDTSDNEGPMQEVKQKGEKRVRTRGKKTEQNSSSTLQSSNVNENVNSRAKDTNRGQKNPKDAQKAKGVSADPHPQDRKSGTGRGKETSKGGAGKGNWGTYKDENKEDFAQDNEQVVEEEEEEEVHLTLDEYMSQKNKASSAQQQAQKDLDEKLLKSYIEKDGCQLVEKKVNIDDHFHKKGKNLKNKEQHHVSLAGESKELLGLRSGLQTYSEKPRVEGEPFQKFEKKAAPVKVQKEENAEEENKEEAVQEEKPQREQGERREQGQRGERRGRGEGRGRGGRGGRGEGRGRGGRGGGQDRGQDRGQNRGPRQNNTQSKVVNIEDDSSFPTLG